MPPSGMANHCPFCRAALGAPAGMFVAQHRCPRCDAELWFFAVSGDGWFFARRPGQSVYEFLAALAAALQLSAADVERFFKHADSLDTVEFLTDIDKAMRSGV